MAPRSIRRTSLLVAAVAVFAVGCAVAPPSTPASTPSPVWHQEMLAAVNAERAKVGAPPVQLCGRLGTAAQAHSDDQAARGVMSHTGGDGSTLAQRANRAGYTGWTRLAENVAAGQPDVGAVMQAWMSSSGHRSNILDAASTHLGLGQTRSGNGWPYWTQKFGTNGTC